MACGVFYWRNDMTAEKRKGRQTPTESVVLPYTQTHGADAVELYNKSGRTAQDWQELLQYDILAVNDEGLWVHTKVGYSVPRRNGKNEIIAMREMWGLQNNEKILHTAHRTTTSHINKVTGAVIDIPCVLSGGDWQAAEPAASSKKKKTKVAPVQQEGGTDERICDS